MVEVPTPAGWSLSPLTVDYRGGATGVGEGEVGICPVASTDFTRRYKGKVPIVLGHIGKGGATGTGHDGLVCLAHGHILLSPEVAAAYCPVSCLSSSDGGRAGTHNRR